MPKMTLAGAMTMVLGDMANLQWGAEEWREQAECVLERFDEASRQPLALAASWVLNAGDAKLHDAHDKACATDPAVAEGTRILNESEDPETLVALWEALLMAADIGKGDWEDFIDSLPDLECIEIARMMEYAIAYAERIATIRDALRARKEGE